MQIEKTESRLPSIAEWRQAVNGNDTILGYQDWRKQNRKHETFTVTGLTAEDVFLIRRALGNCSGNYNRVTELYNEFAKESGYVHPGIRISDGVAQDLRIDKD